MWPLKDGTKVRINASGLRRYPPGPSNPEGLIGIVKHCDESWARVEWSNGTANSYQEGTLTTISNKLENK